MLVLGRILQGLSAAAVCSVGFAMLYDAFGSAGVGGALGWVSAALDAGGFLGPGLAGGLYEVGGENAVFGFAYGFIAVDAALGLLVIVADNQPPSQDTNLDEDASEIDKRASLDSNSSEGSNGSAELFIPGTVKGGCAPDYVPLPKSPFVDEDDDVQSGLLSHQKTDGGGNIMNASKVDSFLQLLLLPRLLVAVSGWLVVGIFETAFDSVLPLFVQDLFQWPIVGAGLIFLPFYLPSIILSPLCGYVADRVRNTPRLLAAAGFFLCGPSFILLGCVDDNTTVKQILLCFLLSLIGIGTAFSGPPLLKEVGVVVEGVERDAPPGTFGPRGAAARAYGVHNAAFAVGSLLGPILAGACKAALGWAAMGWFFGLLSLVSGVVVLVYLEGYIGHVSWRRPRAAPGCSVVVVGVERKGAREVADGGIGGDVNLGPLH